MLLQQEIHPKGLIGPVQSLTLRSAMREWEIAAVCWEWYRGRGHCSCSCALFTGFVCMGIRRDAFGARGLPGWGKWCREGWDRARLLMLLEKKGHGDPGEGCNCWCWEVAFFFPHRSRSFQHVVEKRFCSLGKQDSYIPSRWLHFSAHSASPAP